MIEITILGIGGNGVITIADLLASIANIYGKYISIYSNYGSQMRGGEVIATVKISDNRIKNPKYSSSDIFVIINDTYFNKYQNLINDKTIIIKESNNILALYEILKNLEFTNYEIIENAFKERFKKKETLEANLSIIKSMVK